MTVKHLTIFQEIAQVGSMSQAAKSLHFSQPTLSQTVKELEEHYGGSLFFRESHGLTLTERGELLLTESSIFLKQFQNLETTMTQYEKLNQINRDYPYACQGIDYEKATLENRELFSFTKPKQEDFYQFLRTKEEINGAILLSTCNRMELFLTYQQNSKQELKLPFSYICEFLSLDEKKYQHLLQNYQGKEVFTHLCLLASGVKSQIFGEDQIISQVKLALSMSREFQVTDSYLEVLFRLGITCGKKIRTELNLAQRDTSMSGEVVKLIESNNISQVLVIGNGEMAKHVAERLSRTSCKIFMSVRQYKHRFVKVPNGINPVDYDRIYEIMSDMDSVISATLSPHFTIDYDRFSKLKNKPKLLFDLAVPRDIDPNIGKMLDIHLYNVDDLSKNLMPDGRSEILEEISTLVKKYEKELDKWFYYKEKGENNH